MSFMAQEIAEIPAVLSRLLDQGRAEIGAVSQSLRGRFRRAVFVARGSSDHAAIYARYLFETELGVPSALAAPSVTTMYGASLDWTDSLVVGVSQSGRSPDLVSVVTRAREAGALTLAITNDIASPLARAAGTTIDCRAGIERSVPATKTYVAELAVIAALVGHLAEDPGLIGEVETVPSAIAAWLYSAELGALPSAVADAGGALVLGRGYNLATALEIALKLTETGRVFARGYSTADFEHGPMTLAGPDLPVLALTPDGAAGHSVRQATKRLRAAGAPVWVMGAASGADIALPAPLPDRVSPLVMVVPGLVLAERLAQLRGLDPDAPVGLTKVTRTR